MNTTTSNESLLWLDCVSKIYPAAHGGEVVAVKDLSLQVEQGEIVALLGSSGCGKTSTLRMIAGFEETSRGRILIGGREIHRLAPKDRNVAMAFEGYSLYPPMNIGDNIAFALRAERLAASQVKRQVAEIAALLEIEDILTRYPATVSAGQQQRAGLARALVRRAALHLLDEPIGQLEPQLRALLRGRIKHFIKERGLTAILVTHDQTEANALSDRIAVMEDGCLQQFDTPQRLKDRPANLFTGAFIGEPPMNLFAATVERSAGRMSFILDGSHRLDYALNEFPAWCEEHLPAGRQLVVGVRPHAFKRVEQGGMTMAVTDNQWLGDQTHIAGQFGECALVMVVHEFCNHARGERLHIGVAARDLHLFDRHSGDNLIRESA